MLLTCLFSVLLMYSCRYDNEDDMIDCTTVIPDTISYSRDVQPIFDQHCSGSDCHSGSNPQKNLNLDAAHSYTSLMKPGSGYVDTIHPTRSLLYSSIHSKSKPMPPNGRMSKCTVETILNWIQQKAKNN
jgi:hypothetical protein